MILPQPDAHPDDRGLPVSTLDEIVTAYEQGLTVDTFPGAVNRRRGHYFRYTLDLMLEVIAWCNENLWLGWVVVETENPDRKVGNGFTVIAQYQPPLVEPTYLQDEHPWLGESIVETIMKGELEFHIRWLKG